MSLDTEILRTLATRGRLSAIIEHVGSLPHTQRADAIETIQRGLSKPLSTRLNYIWPLRARESQLPPTGDWDTWLILAGRGFGKTRAGAEWVRAQVEDGNAHRIALVARTLPEAQSIMIEGESGIINISPPLEHSPPTSRPSASSPGPTERFALVFSSHEPDQLRGPQFDAAWCDELASWQYPATRLGDNLAFALQPRTTATLSRHHNTQGRRACPITPHRQARHFHVTQRLHLRESRTTSRSSLLQRPDRPATTARA